MPRNQPDEGELQRIADLEKAGKIVADRHGPHHITLSNPVTKAHVGFYPAKGIIMRSNAKQVWRGLDAALKLIGVAA